MICDTNWRCFFFHYIKNGVNVFETINLAALFLILFAISITLISKEFNLHLKEAKTPLSLHKENFQWINTTFLYVFL